LLILGLATPALATVTETTLYYFSNGSDGGSPSGGLTWDSSGNLYGTAAEDGANGKGVVYKLTPNGSGGWTYSVIYSFTGGSDGSHPYAGVVFDSQGNLYGTCTGGGYNNQGTVFELSPNGSGGWTISKTYDFTDTGDGDNPYGGVILDSAGNVYGTTYGDSYIAGTVFELTSSGSGWTETTIHRFGGGSDGGHPLASLIWDEAGNLYGTTQFGGNSACSSEFEGCGVVFKLHHTGSGWVETTLYAFTGNMNNSDGYQPWAPVVLGRNGRLYGTTLYDTWSVPYGCGGVFELAPPATAPRSAEAGWQITWLYHFPGQNTGCDPQSGLTFDNAGNLYGTTVQSGDMSCGTYGCGVVYEMTPGTGRWTESVVYAFTDGKPGPAAPVIFDAAGNLYSTDTDGGGIDNGFIFELSQ
jgi:uncharacterized repeat protein (TIGR03803 family)